MFHLLIFFFFITKQGQLRVKERQKKKKKDNQREVRKIVFLRVLNMQTIRCFFNDFM